MEPLCERVVYCRNCRICCGILGGEVSPYGKRRKSRSRAGNNRANPLQRSAHPGRSGDQEKRPISDPLRRLQFHAPTAAAAHPLPVMSLRLERSKTHPAIALRTLRFLTLEMALDPRHRRRPIGPGAPRMIREAGKRCASCDRLIPPSESPLVLGGEVYCATPPCMTSLFKKARGTSVNVHSAE